MTTLITSRKTDIPVFAGSETMSFIINDMPPNTRIYTYVNNINVTNFTAPAGSQSLLGDPIITNQLGKAEGFLYIPSSDGIYRFNTGELRITFSDSPSEIKNSTYIAETSLFNHGVNLVDTEQGTTISLRATEKFRTDFSGAVSEENFTQNKLDPLSQTFIVDQSFYPLGIVLTGINLFIHTKDDKLPIGIELRPLSAGKPSTLEYISGTFVSKDPVDIQIYNPETKDAPATSFTFNHPVYLTPGEYAFCVLTKSDKYKIFTARLGLPGNFAVKQPFAGTLFKSQNTGDWVGDDNEDLAFVLRKASFETGRNSFEMQNINLTPMEYSRLRLLSTEINFGNSASVNYRIRTRPQGAQNLSEYQDLLINSSPILRGRQIAEKPGDVKVEINLNTTSKDIAPILDKQLLKAQIFKTGITPYTADISKSEEKATNGGAKSRYISKVVSLMEGFDSDGIEVKLDVNRKIGTDIEVYCRVLARNDSNENQGIFERPWTRLPLVAPSVKTFAGVSDKEFYTETYRLTSPNLEYSYKPKDTLNPGLTSAAFTEFAFYQIKVVFYAENTSFVPKIKNLVAVALK
jgi:hypothetical protein